MIRDILGVDPLMLLPKGLGNLGRALGVLPQMRQEQDPQTPTGKLEM
jgi:hypothetical protein